MALAGDWALGEFNVAGKKANVDYVCANGPGTEGQFVWLADYWGFFKGSTTPARRRNWSSPISP